MQSRTYRRFHTPLDPRARYSRTATLGLALDQPGGAGSDRLPLSVLAGREAALDPAEEAAGALGPGALAHDPQPQLPAIAADDLLEAVPVHARGFECRAPALQRGSAIQDPASTTAAPRSGPARSASGCAGAARPAPRERQVAPRRSPVAGQRGPVGAGVVSTWSAKSMNSGADGSNGRLRLRGRSCGRARRACGAPPPGPGRAGPGGRGRARRRSGRSGCGPARSSSRPRCRRCRWTGRRRARGSRRTRRSLSARLPVEVSHRLVDQDLAVGALDDHAAVDHVHLADLLQGDAAPRWTSVTISFS